MTNFSRSWKHDQVFISFRGIKLRQHLVSFLKKELKRNDINYYIDEEEARGCPITMLFDRIRESGVALVFFSNNYPESCWCLDELVEIKNQMEIGSIVPFPVFYKVKAEAVKCHTSHFGKALFRCEDLVRKKANRGCDNAILATEALIWERRQALVSVGKRMGFSYKHSSDESFLSELVVKVKELLACIPTPKYHIENPLMHPQEAVTSLLQALNLRISDLEDLITKQPININGLDFLTTDLVFLDLNSLKNHVLGQRLMKTGQAGKIFLVFLGSLKDCDKSFAFKPLLFPKKPQKFTENMFITSSQVTNCADVVTISESNDNRQNRPEEDDALTCLSFLCDVVKGCAMMITPPSPRVSISFGEKRLAKNLVSLLIAELKSNQISVHVEDDMRERLKRSNVSIVVFSSKYPESEQCLDELAEIKKLMDAGELQPLPIFYMLPAAEVKEVKTHFLARLLKIEDNVRRNVNRDNYKSILGAEARIWGWRQAIVSIASKSGLSYRPSGSLPVFVTDVVTKVKEEFAINARQKKFISYITTDQLIVKKPLMHQQEITTAIPTVKSKSLDNNLFYSPANFLEALNLDTTDIEGFTEIANCLVSLRLKGDTNLVCLKFDSIENLVEFQRSSSFKFLEKAFALNLSGLSRFEKPSLVLTLNPINPNSSLVKSECLISTPNS